MPLAKAFCSIALCFVHAANVYSQSTNLIPNGSFDNVTKFIPKGQASLGDLSKAVYNWYTFGGLFEGTPDFISPYLVWNKSLQKLSASSRNNFVGIHCLSHPSSEIISTKLDADLQPGSLYKISLRVNAPLFNPFSAKKQLPRNLENNFGFVFSTDKAPNLLSLHTTEPHVVFRSWVIPGKWSHVVAYFTPDSSFKYVHIGCFFPKEETVSLYYYLVDDIAVSLAGPADTVTNSSEPLLEPALHPLDSGAVFFDANSYALTDSAIRTIDDLGDYLTLLPDGFTLVLSGHADTTGEYSYNQTLSQKRTEAVFKHLIQKGVEPSTIRSAWFGSSLSNTTSSDANSLRLDRRVGWKVEKSLDLEHPKTSTVYFFSNEIEAEQDQDVKRSFVGNYQVETSNTEANSTLDSEDLPLLLGSQPVPAANVILAKAKNAQVLMLNERHHQPAHRAFATQLLNGLFSQGYRILALEMLAEAGDSLMARRYPVVQSGYYFPEPYLGDFVRMAIDKGFKVARYEANPAEVERIADSLFQVEKLLRKTDLPPDDPTFAMNARDYVQAVNLKEIIGKNPGSKVFVYCGSGHIRERKYANWHSLALFLKTLAKIDPLTVDQAHSPNAVPSGIAFAAKNKSVPLPTVFLDSISKKPFVAREYDLLAKAHLTGQFDIQVFHPDGDAWQLVNGHRKMYNLDTLIQSYAKECPCLLYLWHAHEDETDAVPVVVKEIDFQAPNANVLLPPGSFTLVLHDKSRKTLLRKNFNSKN